MASREQLDALRSLAKQRHRAATRKVSRLKTRAGVEIAGTKLDPRRDLGSLKKLNSKQLEAYVAKLDTFTSRKTNIVAGMKGRPIAGDKLAQLHRLEAQINKNNAKFYDQVKDIYLPSIKRTVKQSVAMVPEHQTTGSPAARAPHIPVVTNPKGVPNNKKLDQKIADAQKKLTDKTALVRDRKIARKMMVDIGKIASSFTDENGKKIKFADLKRDVRKMSDAKFNFLWNYTGFADVASFDYHVAKSKMNDRKGISVFDSAFDTQLREIHKKINEVKQLNI